MLAKSKAASSLPFLFRGTSAQVKWNGSRFNRGGDEFVWNFADGSLVFCGKHAAQTDGS